ncbi:Hsp20/alpha crystallin family protein [Patescibacteria group bacterium]|nr:Hsp20/alpha crystallin family protein [Patescibacteria group bacterium]
MAKGLLDGLAKLLDVAEKLAETQGNGEAKENVEKTKEAVKGGLDLNLGGLLNKVMEFAEKAGEGGSGESTREFAGGKGIVSSGIRGSILGKSFGGGPLGGRGRPKEADDFKPRVHKKTNASKEKMTAPKVKEVRGLEMDIFEEKDCIKIIGDMPGCDKENIKCHVDGKTLKIQTTGNRKYKKEIELPVSVNQKQKPVLKYKNGILEIELKKKSKKKKQKK